MREFKPEQVKRYLAREVIAGLPNAAAIDLSQFAGLIDADARATRRDDEYARAARRAARRARRRRPRAPYEVSVVGRWTEVDAARPAAPAAGARAQRRRADHAAGRPALRVRGRGRRRPAPRRAAVGGRRPPLHRSARARAATSRVNGTYTSRRHAEIWLEQRRLVGRPTPARPTASASSRRPARVERCGGAGGRRAGGTAIELPRCAHRAVGARRRAGRPTIRGSRCGRRARAASRADADRRRRAGAEDAADADPASRPRRAALLTLTGAAGDRRAHAGAARRRAAGDASAARATSTLVDRPRARGGVGPSPRHRRASTTAGAQVVVHGDNGVIVDGVHASGRARASAGRSAQAMVLGAPAGDEPACTLTLARMAAVARTSQRSLITPLEPGRRAAAAQRRRCAPPAVRSHTTLFGRIEAAVGVVVRQPARRQRRRAQRARRHGRRLRRRRRRRRRRDGARWRAASSSRTLHAALDGRPRRRRSRARGDARRRPRDRRSSIAAADRRARRGDGRAVRAGQRAARRAGWSPGSAIAASTGSRRAAARPASC